MPASVSSVPRARGSASDGTCLLTGCHPHAHSQRGSEDVAEWREFAHQMHRPGSPALQKKGDKSHEEIFLGDKVPAARGLDRSSDLSSIRLHAAWVWWHGVDTGAPQGKLTCKIE